MAAPVLFVAMRAVAVVQEIVQNETLGGPGTRDEHQIRLVLENRLFSLFTFVVVKMESGGHLGRRDLDRDVF